MSVRAPVRRVALVALLALLACLALVRFATTPGEAASGWLGPDTLVAADTNIEGAQVALDAQGDALAVWIGRRGNQSVVQAARRPAGAGWQPPEDLAPPGYVSPYLQVAMTPRGGAAVLWETFRDRTYVAMSAFRPAGGAWGRAARVWPGSRRPGLPQLALDPRGNAFALWAQRTREGSVVRVAVRPRTGRWRRPSDLERIPGTRSDGFAGARIAVAATGDAIAIWTRASARRVRGLPTSMRLRAAVRPKGAGWQRPVTISAADKFVTPADVALDPQGNGVAIWTSAAKEDSFATRLNASARPAGGRWQAPVRVSAPDEAVGVAHVALDPRGNATALWSRSLRRGFSIVRSAIRPAGGSWRRPVDVSNPAERAGSGWLALDGQGSAFAVWHRYLTFHEDTEQYDTVVRAAARRGTSAWQAPVDLSPAGMQLGFDPLVAGSPAGGALAIWGRSVGHAAVVQAAAHGG